MALIMVIFMTKEGLISLKIKHWWSSLRPKKKEANSLPPPASSYEIFYSNPINVYMFYMSFNPPCFNKKWTTHIAHAFLSVCSSASHGSQPSHIHSYNLNYYIIVCKLKAEGMLSFQILGETAVGFVIGLSHLLTQVLGKKASIFFFVLSRQYWFLFFFFGFTPFHTK